MVKRRTFSYFFNFFKQKNSYFKHSKRAQLETNPCSSIPPSSIYHPFIHPPIYPPTHPPHSKVQGLCGNMDGSIQNDYKSRSGIEEDVLSFCLSYAHSAFQVSDAYLGTDSCSSSFGNVGGRFWGKYCFHSYSIYFHYYFWFCVFYYFRNILKCRNTKGR